MVSNQNVSSCKIRWGNLHATGDISTRNNRLATTRESYGWKVTILDGFVGTFLLALANTFSMTP